MKHIYLFVIILLQANCLFPQQKIFNSPGDLSSSIHSRKVSAERKGYDSTEFLSASIPAEYYDNGVRISTFKTDSVMVTASLPYKVCKDSSFTISLKVKNLSRQAIYCMPDMNELIGFGEDLLTSKCDILIEYTFENYDGVDRLVKLIKIEPDSTFMSDLSLKLNNVGKFDPKDYFFTDIIFGYIPSNALIKTGRVKPGMNENTIMVSVYEIGYLMVEVDFGTFRSGVETCP